MTNVSLIIAFMMQVLSVNSNDLPESISQLISKKYKNWELVSYSFTKSNKEKVIAKFIQGDFNGDSTKDYAVMIKINNDPQNCTCLAFVSHSNRYVLFTIGEKYSVSHSDMRFEKKGSIKFNYASQNETVLANDAFTIITEGCKTYIFQDDRFESLSSCD